MESTSALHHHVLIQRDPSEFTPPRRVGTPRPIRDQVLVRQYPAPPQIGMIHVPDGALKDWPPFARVVAIGAGRPGEPPSDFAVGDKVLFKRRPGSALIRDNREAGVWEDAPVEWENLIMLRWDDILGIVEEG